MELEESLKALVEQNTNLVELLEKANIKVPHFAEPKLLSFIITVHDSKTKDNNQNENAENKMEIKTIVAVEAAPQPKSDNRNVVIQKQPPNGHQTKSTDSSCVADGKTVPKLQLNALPKKQDVQSFGSVDLIPVTSSSIPELKVHEKPVKNFVEITPLMGGQNEKVPTTSETSCDLIQMKKQPISEGIHPRSFSLLSVFLMKIIIIYSFP